MCLAQCLFRGGGAPFAFGLLPIRRELREMPFTLRLFERQLFESPRDLVQAPRARRRACGIADVDGLRLAPGAGQGAQAIAPVGRDPGFGRAGFIHAAGHTRQQAGDAGGGDGHSGGHIGGHGGTQPTGQGCLGKRWPRDPLAVEPGRAVSADKQRAVGRDPGIQQPGGFQCGFEPGPRGGVDRVVEVDQLPQWRPALLAAAVGGAGVGYGGSGVVPGGQAFAFGFEFRLFLA